MPYKIKELHKQSEICRTSYKTTQCNGIEGNQKKKKKKKLVCRCPLIATQHINIELLLKVARCLEVMDLV